MKVKVSVERALRQNHTGAKIWISNDSKCDAQCAATRIADGTEARFTRSTRVPGGPPRVQKGSPR